MPSHASPRGGDDSPLAIGERAFYLHPGQLHAAPAPAVITTVLGSCVAVCLYVAARGIGGINHYLLPHHAGGQDASSRFGPTAIRQLLDTVVRLGASPASLEAKLFGGACVLEPAASGKRNLGAQNVALARELLAESRIPVRAEDVGGTRGRKLIFRVDDGAAWVRTL